MNRSKHSSALTAALFCTAITTAARTTFSGVDESNIKFMQSLQHTADPSLVAGGAPIANANVIKDGDTVAVPGSGLDSGMREPDAGESIDTMKAADDTQTDTKLVAGTAIEPDATLANDGELAKAAVREPGTEAQ